MQCSTPGSRQSTSYHSAQGRRLHARSARKSTIPVSMQVTVIAFCGIHTCSGSRNARQRGVAGRNTVGRSAEGGGRVWRSRYASQRLNRCPNTCRNCRNAAVTAACGSSQLAPRARALMARAGHATHNIPTSTSANFEKQTVKMPAVPRTGDE